MPATMSTCTVAVHVTVPVDSPPRTPANQYGTSATRPTTADPIAALSHQVRRVNKPAVARQKPATVDKLRTRVDHRSPEVATPFVAKAGVVHSQVVPARNKATPPIFRMVNMTITSFSN